MSELAVYAMGTIELDSSGESTLGEPRQEGEAHGQPESTRAQERYKIIDYFRSCQAKTELLAGFLKFVRPCFGTVVVFSVQPQGIKYLDGHGEGLKAGHSLKMPIAWMNGVLIRRTILQRMPYQGAIPIDIEEKQMFSQFLHTLPANCWLYPAAIGDGVDCLIYADTPKLAPHMATQRLEFVLGKMVLSLRRLLVEHLLVHG